MGDAIVFMVLAFVVIWWAFQLLAPLFGEKRIYDPFRVESDQEAPRRDR